MHVNRFAIYGDVNKNGTEMILKYEEFALEIQSMWNVEKGM